MPGLNNIIVLLILLAGAAFSIGRKKLTVPATIAGAVAGWLVYAGGGYTGLVMLTSFFIMGTAATSWNIRKTGPPKNVTRFPERSHICPSDNEPPVRSGKVKGAAAQTTRTMSQVLANGGVAALAGLGIIFFPACRHPLELAMAGSLASATADTLSSELGMVYGRRYYNILTWKPDQRGLDGVVSIEGLTIGSAGSAVIALLYAVSHGWHTNGWIIILSGTVGNLVDSLLGAALERKGFIGNDMVNFLNTLVAGMLAAALATPS